MDNLAVAEHVGYAVSPHGCESPEMDQSIVRDVYLRFGVLGLCTRG